MIRVAIADDSAFTCRLVASYFDDAGDCEIVGVAHDVPSTVDLVRATTPDVLTLDLEMPGGNGLDLLRLLGATSDARVLVISGVTKRAAATTLRALELGAVDFVMKYTPGAPTRPETLRREVLAKVRAAAGARRPVATPPTPTPPVVNPGSRRHDSAVIVIGASTGGPHAVRDLLVQLPADFQTPCIVVQHLPPLFTPVFSAELERHVRVPVRHAATGDRLEAGRVLIAPGASHLVLASDGTIGLRPTRPSDPHRPSIDVTMASAAEVFGRGALGVVLTGMGNDGSEGLRRIREHGGTAYVQELASCVVPSMPARALERAGADHVATPAAIGHMLANRRLA